MKKIPVIVIAGATASGKTALSVEIAKKYNGEIISADSMQIYKEMNIGTAKPEEAEKQGITHHLMDFLPPDVQYSVADFVEDAHEAVGNIIKKGKIPVMVGGTGLYINSFVNDISFDDGGKDENVRRELEEYAKENGCTALWNMLKEIDLESAENIHPENVKRVIRAIEFYRVSGKTISEHNKESRLSESRYNPLMFAIKWDREELYRRIDMRVDIMMESGLWDEVYALYKKGYTKKMQSMQGIGYRQLLDCIRGFSTKEEAVNIIKRDSRRYAKRQNTWFKRDERIHWLDAKNDILKQSECYIDSFLAENKQIFTKI